jgi:hypothetical protein
MFKSVYLTCVLTLSAVGLSAQVTTVLPDVRTSGMVGIGDAQTAQLTLLNPGMEAPALGIICTAMVSFVDASGRVLKSATLTIAPGKSIPFVLRSDVDLNLIAGQRREIRATISTPGVPPPATPTAAATPTGCKLIPTLEILDTVTGRTLVVLGHAAMIPQVVATTAP